MSKLYPNSKNKLSKGQRDCISEVIEFLSMENASFDGFWDDPNDPLPTSEKEVTEFIRRRTKLWRQSWVIGPLQALLENAR